jgi:hypothetical protein
MNKPRLKLWFSDFWGGFQYWNNYFYYLISQKYTIDLAPINPDILIYSCFGDAHKGYGKKTHKIFYTGENKEPNYNECDASLSFCYDCDNNVRLPLWVLYIDWFNKGYPNGQNPSYLIPIDCLLTQRQQKRNNRICLIANNPAYPRTQYLIRPNVDVYCQLGMPLGGDEKTKLDKLSEYGYSLAFENSIGEGYVTEKLLHALAAGTLPLYYGSKDADSDFNVNAFERIGIDTLKEIEEGRGQFAQIKNEPIFYSEKHLLRWSPPVMINKLESIL